MTHEPLPAQEIDRQVRQAKALSPRRLPDSWWEPGVAERMCEWMKRTYGEQQR